MTDGIKHNTVGTELTQTEWEAQGGHTLVNNVLPGGEAQTDVLILRANNTNTKLAADYAGGGAHTKVRIQASADPTSLIGEFYSERQTPPYGQGLVLWNDLQYQDYSFASPANPGATTLTLAHKNANSATNPNSNYCTLAFYPDPEWTIAAERGEDVHIQVHDFEGNLTASYPVCATLAGPINDSVTTIAYSNKTATFIQVTYAQYLYVKIDDEIIKVGTDNDNLDGTGTLTGCSRGQKGSTAASHATGASIKGCTQHAALEIKTSGLTDRSNLITRMALDYNRDWPRWAFMSAYFQFRNDETGYAWPDQPLIYIYQTKNQAALYVQGSAANTTNPVIEAFSNSAGMQQAIIRVNQPGTGPGIISWNSRSNGDATLQGVNTTGNGLLLALGSNSAGNSGYMIKVKTVSKAYNSDLFNAAALTNNAVIWNVPTTAIMLGVFIQSDALDGNGNFIKFSGPGITDLDITLGDAGDNAGFLTQTMNLITDTGGSRYETRGVYWNALVGYKEAAAKDWIAYATAVGGNLNTLTQGQVTFHFYYMDIDY